MRIIRRSTKSRKNKKIWLQFICMPTISPIKNPVVRNITILPPNELQRRVNLRKVVSYSWFLDFKLSPGSKCCMLSSGLFPGVWILCADVSEHSVCSIFIGRWFHIDGQFSWNQADLRTHYYTEVETNPTEFGKDSSTRKKSNTAIEKEHISIWSKQK